MLSIIDLPWPWNGPNVLSSYRFLSKFTPTTWISNSEQLWSDQIEFLMSASPAVSVGKGALSNFVPFLLFWAGGRGFPTLDHCDIATKGRPHTCESLFTMEYAQLARRGATATQAAETDEVYKTRREKLLNSVIADLAIDLRYTERRFDEGAQGADELPTPCTREDPATGASVPQR